MSSKKTLIFHCALISVLLWLYAVKVSENFFLSDDAFISFRYADNLAEGLGLVWNDGERVEGYTNFLWVLLISAGIKAGIAPESLSAAIGVLSGLLLLFSVARFAAKYFRSGPFLSYLVSLPFLLSRSFTAWCTSGLETMFFTLVLFTAFTLLIEARQENSRLLAFSALFFAVAALTRPEGLLFAAVAFFFVVWDIFRKKTALKAALLSCLPFFVLVGGHFFWRYHYYGFILPNTFHAKVAGIWLEQALRYLSLFNSDYLAVFFLPFFAAPLLFKRDYISALFFSIVAFYLVYIFYVGGDRFEFRFLVVVMPYFYLLIFYCLLLLARIKTGSPAIRGFAQAVSAGVFAALLFCTHSGSANPAAKKERFGVASIQGIRNYAERRSQEGKFLRSLVERKLLPADTVICVGGAGALPYYSKLPTVDRRGLSDLHIARLPIEKRGIIAHEHDAPAAYLKKRQVVMFDYLNRLVHKKQKTKYFNKSFRHDGHAVDYVTVKALDRYLIFGSFVSDQELRRIFSNLEILSSRTATHLHAAPGTQDAAP